jgi:hypothetical protein
VSRSLKNETNNYEHSFLSVSSSLKNETDTHEHNSLSMSRSLKKETDPPPIESNIQLDLVLEPSFPSPLSVDPLSSSLSSEPIPISIRESNRVQKKCQREKRSLGGMSPTSGHHAGVKLLASVDHDGGKVPNSGIILGRKPANGYHLSIVHFWF